MKRLRYCLFVLAILAASPSCVHRHDRSEVPKSSDHDYPTRTEVPPVKINYEIP